MGVDKYAEKLEQLTRFNEGLKEVSIENLFRIAKADENITKEEMKVLTKVAKIIDLDQRCFAKMKCLFTPKPIDNKLAKFYDVLGVPYDANITEIKSRWKKLIVIYHPDKLAEASSEEIKIATERMAEINLAYQEIMRIKSKK